MILFESERLYIKPFTKEDADIFFELNGDAEIMQYIRKPKTREQSDAFLLENLQFYYANPGLGRFALFSKSDHAFAGTFSLLPLEDSNYIHLGYALLKSFQGKGLATELVKASLPYVFRIIQKDTVHALTVADNIASQKVLLKCGFQFTHTILRDDNEVMVFDLSREKAANYL